MYAIIFKEPPTVAYITTIKMKKTVKACSGTSSRTWSIVNRELIYFCSINVENIFFVLPEALFDVHTHIF